MWRVGAKDGIWPCISSFHKLNIYIWATLGGEFSFYNVDNTFWCDLLSRVIFCYRISKFNNILAGSIWSLN